MKEVESNGVAESELLLDKQGMSKKTFKIHLIFGYFIFELINITQKKLRICQWLPLL